MCCTWTANAIGKPVVVGPIEATAIGNILVQAIATGDIASLADAREIVRNSYETVTYQPQDTAQWNDVYQQFKDMLDQSW